MKKLRVALITLLGSLVCVFAALGVAACNKEPEVATYTVTFVYDDGGVTPNKQETVNEGDTVNRPTDPTRTDYLFAGWYNGTTLYTFRDGVTSDLTLTAHWNKDGYALTWTENEAISYVYDGTLPTFVDKGADVSFGVKQVNPFYDVDEGGIVVKAGGTVLEAENGVYTFKADAAKTITVEGLTKNTRPMTGTGTKADPYVITTAYQLKTFSDRVNSDDNNDNAYASYVKLGADIDYYGYQFTPIACQYNFRGNFDGQGKTISNIEFVTEYDAYGLFGYAYQATVQNVNVKGMNINPEFEEGAYLLGGIVAYNFGSDVINCSAQGSMNINVNNSDLTVFAGGVCGFMQGTSVTGAIQYCTSDVTIQSPGSNAVYSVGGIVGAEVGLSDSALAITTNCVANVNINGQINFAGGVAGFIRDRSAVVNCFTSGQIRATDPDNKLAAAGAIVGLAANESVIKNCYSYARTQDNVAISGDLKTDETKVIGKYQPANWNSLYSNAVLVENSYVLDFSGEYGDKDFNTEAGVLQNMKWNEEEWIFTDATVLTPGVKFVATLTNPIIVTLNFGNETLTVSGGTQIGEKKDTLPAYTPAGMVYPNMLHSAWTGSNGGLSTWISDNGYFPYGVFFDAALTQPVPAAYVFTEDKTVFAGFADYDAFKGEYAVQYNGQLSTVAFDSIFADIPFANSGSIIIVYVEENVIRLVKPSIVSGDGDYFVTFNEDGTITITDGINLRLTGYIPNSVTGSWFDSDNTEYKFNHDYTGTIGSGSDAVSFEYEVNGNTIIVKIGEENSDAYTLSTADGTLTNNDTNAVLRQKAYDAYRGVWETAFNVKSDATTVTIDGQSKINIGGTEYDYTVNDGNGRLEITGTQTQMWIDEDTGWLISNTGMALYAENSFVGTWKTPTNSSSNFTITFTGIFGKEGFRFAFDAAGEDFYYETVKVGANQINIRLYLIDYETESYDLLATAQYSSATQTITLGSRELQCFDAFEGEWIVGNTTASSGEIAFAFDGRGLYGGEVTVSVEDGDDVTDVKVPYTYTTDGTGSFTYNGTTYNIWTGSQYGEKLIFIGVGDTATYLLYAADEYSGLRITGKYLDVTFDGTSNVNLGAKGYALIKTGGSQGLFRYDIDEDGDVTLYGSKDGQLVKVYRLDLNDDKLFELKQYNESGNSVDPTTVDTLGLFSYFLNLTWESMYPEEGADNSFVLESVNLDGIGKGTLYGEAITFEYYNPAVLFFNNGAYSMQYQGQDSYVTGMFNMNTGKAADIFIVYDDFLGEYTAANGDTLVMDGFGYSAGFFGEVAEAKLTIGEVETTYAYVILQGNAYLCNEEGNPVYIVCLVQPNGLPAVEFTDEDGNSVWLVSVADLS